MGLIRKAASIGTLGLINFRSKSERLEALEGDLDGTIEERDRLAVKASKASKRAKKAELEAVDQAKKAKKAKRRARKMAGVPSATELSDSAVNMGRRQRRKAKRQAKRLAKKARRATEPIADSLS